MCWTYEESNKKSIEKILTNIWFQARNMGDATNEEYIKINVRAIKDYYLAKLPLLKTNICEFDNRVVIGEINKAERRGFNQAIAEMRKAIEEG